MRNLPIGTFINMAAVAAGSLAGIGLRQVFPENIQLIIFQAIGLATLLIGIRMSFKLPDGYLLVLVFSLILGGVVGELLGVKEGLHALGEWVKASLSIGDTKFTEGLVTAFLLFCIGSMTIVGAIEEGIQGKRELLLIKSTLDGISAIAFASTYGIGVLFSIFPMLLLQGGITMTAARAQRWLTPLVIEMLSATGGVLIIGIGINLLALGKVNIENLLPSLLLVVLLTMLYHRRQAKVGFRR